LDFVVAALEMGLGLSGEYAYPLGVCAVLINKDCLY